MQVKLNQHLELWTNRMNRIAMARMITECCQLQQILDAPTLPPSWETWTAIYGSLKIKMKLVDIIVSCCSSVVFADSVHAKSAGTLSAGHQI